MIVGLGAIGSFLYYFMIKALNADIDARYRKTKYVQYLCGIFTIAVALAIHLWSATLAWFTTYLGPRIGQDAALTAVTAYQDDMLVAILPMYIPMVLVFGIHFVMLIGGKHVIPGGCSPFIWLHGTFCWLSFQILHRPCRYQRPHGCPL